MTNDTRIIKAAAALSAPHAKAGVSVKVKELEWEEVPDTGGEWFQADTGFGKYRAELVRAQKGKKWRVWSDAIRNDLPALFDTLEAAKAAAQADYDARILSALSTKLQEPVAWRVTWYDGAVEYSDTPDISYNPQTKPRIEPLYTLAHKPVAAGLEKALDALVDERYSKYRNEEVCLAIEELHGAFLAALKSKESGK